MRRDLAYRETAGIIGKNLKRLRERDKVTQKDLGRILQVSSQMIQKYEYGKTSVSSIYLYLLAKYFDVSIEEFFEANK